MNRSLSRLIRAMSTSTASRLAGFSTCEISDALIKLGVPAGGYIPDINMMSPSTHGPDVRICAPAYTVQMVTASSTAHKLSAHYVDTATEGSVIVIDAPPSSVWFLSSTLSPFNEGIQTQKAQYGVV
jgi:regulator of RNase E activity RraA